jgi:hypothetical protein
MLSSLCNGVQSVDCPPQMTLLQTAFASPSVLRVAHAAGLPLEDSSARLQRAAGLFAKQSTLLVAYELGLQCTGSVVNGVAASGSLHKMAYACTHFPHRILDEAAWYAASSGSIDMIKLLQQQDIPVYNRQTMRVAHKYGHSKLHDHIVALCDSPMLQLVNAKVKVDRLESEVTAIKQQYDKLMQQKVSDGYFSALYHCDSDTQVHAYTVTALLSKIFL